MNYKIEKFNKNDLDELHSLIIDTVKKCYFEYYPKEAVDYFVSYLNKDDIENESKNNFVIVLKINNKIIGTGTLIDTHIKRVFINPISQGNGYGKIIMNTLEEEAKKKGYKIVELHSSLYAKRFYDSIGYKMFKIGKVVVENNEILYFQRMAKSLSHNKTDNILDLNNKKFKVIKNAGEDIEVNENTIFKFYQNNELVYAEYNGGKVKYGEMFGIIENNSINFYYEQENLSGRKNKGNSVDKIIKLNNNRIQLIHECEWRSKRGKGICVLEEIYSRVNKV